MPPLLGAFLAVVFWGVSFVATKAVLSELSPIAIVCARSAIGAVLLAGILRARGESMLPPRSSLGPLAVMGFVGVAFHGLLQAHALALTTAVNTGWLIALIPVWSALLAAVLGRERFRGGKVGGIIVGFAGTLLVVARGRLDAGVVALPAARGDLLVLASTVNWAIYSLLGHATIRRLGPTRATAGAMTLGTLMLLPFFLAGGGPGAYARLSLAGIGAILFLGVACSGLGYLYWYRALERVEASRVAALLYLEPLVTLGAAVLLLGEPVGLMTVVGGVLVVGGVALVQRASPGVPPSSPASATAPGTAP
jgi:drug/metabolite transporter (DMT)-like permease